MFELNTASATILLCLSVVCAATLSYVPTRDPFAMEVLFSQLVTARFSAEPLTSAVAGSFHVYERGQ